MLNFHISSDSEVPASKQLLAQIQFAIASGQYDPSRRLPSTRQLAMITGLHRNTISKVYQQLEEIGLVKSVAGSGIYINKIEKKGVPSGKNNLLIEGNNKIEEIIDSYLKLGYSLSEIRDFFTEEIDWRLSCNKKVVVIVPQKNLNAGQIMQQELIECLGINIELISQDELPELLSTTNFGTLITNRYFLQEIVSIVPLDSFRVIPIDIYDYGKELELIRKLPPNATIGIVSLSQGTLDIAASIVNSQRGNDLLVLTASPREKKKLKILIKNSHNIIVGPSSYKLFQQEMAKIKKDLVRIPQVICSDNYISTKSIDLLKRELELN